MITQLTLIVIGMGRRIRAAVANVVRTQLVIDVVVQTRLLRRSIMTERTVETEREIIARRQPKAQIAVATSTENFRLAARTRPRTVDAVLEKGVGSAQAPSLALG